MSIILPVRYNNIETVQLPDECDLCTCCSNCQEGCECQGETNSMMTVMNFLGKEQGERSEITSGYLEIMAEEEALEDSEVDEDSNSEETEEVVEGEDNPHEM